RPRIDTAAGTLPCGRVVHQHTVSCRSATVSCRRATVTTLPGPRWPALPTERDADEQDYLASDGLGLAELVDSGEVRADELLAAARARACAVNPRIGAICTWLDDYADQRVTERLTGPFAGVPFLLKDLHQQLAGQPTSD